MEQFKLCYENNVVLVQCQQVIEHVIKVCSIRNRVFILSSDNNLFFGDFDSLLPEAPTLELSFVRHCVIDVDCDSKMVYAVEDNGRVVACPSASVLETSNWKDLVVLNDCSCPHGQRNTTAQVPISRVTCNYNGVLFQTRSRQLYGLGEFNDLLNSKTPQRIKCFRGLKVLQVSAGNNFVVVLTQKKRMHSEQPQPSLDEDGLSVGSTDSNDVFVNAECPKCVSANHLNPLPNYSSSEFPHQQHLLNHHNHLQHLSNNNISKSTTETSVASSPCPSDTSFEEDLPNNNKSTPMKTDPPKDSSALNYLLDLSHSQTKNITSMLSEGVKTLSRHMSGGSDNNDSTVVVSNTETEENTSSSSPQDVVTTIEVGGDFPAAASSDSDQKNFCNETMDAQEENPSPVDVARLVDVQSADGLDSMDQSEEASNSVRDLGSTTDLQSEFCGTENRIANMCRMGSNLIDTDVWCFGSVNRGQLATGDHIRRTSVNSVWMLSGQGVVKIDCGKEHSAALTLDGRLFMWGSNARNQISSDTTDSVSSPRLLQSSEPILDVSCGHGQTVILSNDLRIAEQSHEEDSGKLETEEKRKKLPLLDVLVTKDVPCSIMDMPTLLASDLVTVQNHRRFVPELTKHLTDEQKFLRQALSRCQLVRPLMKKLGVGDFRYRPAVEKLFQQYLVIVQVTALHVRSLLEFYSSRITSVSDLAILQNSNEWIAVFRTYARRFFDVFCGGDMKQLEKETLDPVEKTLTLAGMFNEPINRIWAYIRLIYDLQKLGDDSGSSSLLDDKQRLWERLCNEKDAMIDEANQTLTFWEKNPKSQVTRKLQIPERRLVMDSKRVPLKALKGQPWLVLFSDVLCNMQNGGSVIPLETLWTSPITDTDQRKNAFKIVTPLDTQILVAQSHTEKLQWLGALEQCIRVALKQPSRPHSKVPQFRNASFVFPGDHPKYGGVKYFGRWHLGKMHGIGHLVFPDGDGRVYNGQVSSNEISGFGRMYTPRVGIYEGDFERGKYHGYGVLELQNKTTYEGNFRQGMYNGHGTLMSDEGTYTGEFVDNQRQGYGVLDENGSLDEKGSMIKYMGQFWENRKHGRGICITVQGDYFVGEFVADQLSGEGVASFEAQGHGSYYEGKMTLYGPNGQGVMYIAAVPVDDVVEEYHGGVGVEECDGSGLAGQFRKDGSEFEECRKASPPPKTVNGTLMRGVLSGTWKDIQVSSGTLKMGEKFPNYSAKLRKPIVKCKEKWQALFNDWQLQVFGVHLVGGDFLGEPELDPKMIWGKVAVFTNNAKSKEKLKSDEFLAKNFNSVTFLSGGSATATTSGSGGSAKKSGRLSNATSWDNLSVKSQQIQNITSSVAVLAGGLGSSLKALNLKTGSRLTLDDRKSTSMSTMSSEGVWLGEGNGALSEVEMSRKLEKFEHLLQAVGEDRDEDQHIHHNHSQEQVVTRGIDDLLPSSSSKDRFGRMTTTKRSLHLDFVPSFGMNTVESQDELRAIRSYLSDAFKDPHHPLGILASKISHCFYSSYGCWKNKPTPILSSHAMCEWESIMQRVYTIIRHMFPGLPQDPEVIDGEYVSFSSVLYPILVSEGIYSLFFVLYASKCSKPDELYRQRLILCEKKTDQELASFLTIDEKLLPIIKSSQIEEAIERLKQLADKYYPLEMLGLIQQMFKAIEEATREAISEEYVLSSDDIIPIFLFMVIRANVQHLGAEISLLEDLMRTDFDQIMQGYAGFCFTTLQASYQYILSDKFFG